MHATIQSETDDDIELTVTDTNETSHELALDWDGEVTRHRTRNGSGALVDRTEETTEALLQVRRFAKYYLYRERGVAMLTPYAGWERITYPERLAVAALVIGSMSPETVASELDASYHQRAHPSVAGSGPVEPPADCEDPACQLIEQDVYIDIDPFVTQALLDTLVELEALGGLRQLMDMYPRKDDTRLLDRIEGILSEPPGGQAVTGTGTEASGVPAITGVSPVRVHWQTADGTRVESSGEFDASDARIGCRLQLPGAGKPVRSVPAFQRLVVDHLLCQMRDCYVGMGLAPPRDLRVLGPGIAALSAEYEREETYQSYHDTDAVVDWTRLAPLPSL